MEHSIQDKVTLIIAAQKEKDALYETQADLSAQLDKQHKELADEIRNLVGGNYKPVMVSINDEPHVVEAWPDGVTFKALHIA